MAKILTEEILKALKKFDLPKGYQRTGEFPLDPSSIFSSKADADLYAAGGADSRGLSGTRYAGQLIAVVEGGVTTLYTVEANDTLKAVGGDVTADLADLTSKVNAILDGATIDSFKDVEDALAALPKDMVVSGGEVRKPTTDEVAVDATLDATKEYIILTIKNAEEGKDKLFVAADALVDVYTGSEYITITDHTVEANITAIETKLVADDFAKKADITAITDTLATQESLNTVKSTADSAASKADSNEGRIGTLENVIGTEAEGENPATGLRKEIAEKAAKSDLETVTTDVETLKTSVSELKVKDVDATASSGVALNLDTEGKVSVNVSVETLTAAIKPNLGLTSGDIKLKANIGGTDDNPTYAANAALQDVLASIDSRISANASSIVAVEAGNGIAVDSSLSTKPKVSVKTAENSGLTATASGLALSVSEDSNLAINAEGNLDLVWLDEKGNATN